MPTAITFSPIKHIDTITDTRDEVQVMIDDDDASLNESRYFPNPVNHLLRLKITHAARRFIKQQKTGASRGRPGKFKTPRIPIVQFTSPPMSDSLKPLARTKSSTSGSERPSKCPAVARRATSMFSSTESAGNNLRF
ncbi:hypothetical protein CM1200mP19_2820 [bacterium]|nr:MAG: hypothetical protein CM1200mP19_2820 [bacterium]